jgi:hypothetical protein
MNTNKMIYILCVKRRKSGASVFALEVTSSVCETMSSRCRVQVACRNAWGRHAHVLRTLGDRTREVQSRDPQKPGTQVILLGAGKPRLKRVMQTRL